MSYTHVLKSGKTVTTDAYGNTTITKMQNGRKVTKTYNMGNMTAGTVIGDAGSVKVGHTAVHVQGQAERKLGSEPANVLPGVPVGGIAGRANQRAQVATQRPASNPAPVQPNPGSRSVRNQFNIMGSVIGQMAIGNKGTTVFNNETKHFEKGSSNVDYKIMGGNFSQANIGGHATYNNKDVQLNATSGGGGTGGLSLHDLAYSDMVAEERVLRILRKGITADAFMGVLRKGYTIQTLENALAKGVPVNIMVRSMLENDEAMHEDGDD